MRVISKSRLVQFWEMPGCEDGEGPLRAWHTHVGSRSVDWGSWADVKADFASASCGQLCRLQHRGKQIPADHSRAVPEPQGVRPQGDDALR